MLDQAQLLILQLGDSKQSYRYDYLWAVKTGCTRGSKLTIFITNGNKIMK